MYRFVSPMAAVLSIFLMSVDCAGLRGSTCHAGEPGFESLFDGRTLAGWVSENNGQFSVRNGMLVVNKGTGWLRSEQVYGDFILKMEFRFLEKEANSGIFVRTAATSKKDANGWPDNGYQIQCMDIITGDKPLATMIPYGAPAFTFEMDAKALAKAYHPMGDWNLYEIQCLGEELTVRLNGVLITKAHGIKNLRGHIGIQAEHGLLEFRQIAVKTEGLDRKAVRQER